MTIVTRAGKGSPLTHSEMDGNFEHLEAKLALSPDGLEPGMLFVADDGDGGWTLGTAQPEELEPATVEQIRMLSTSTDSYLSPDRTARAMEWVDVPAAGVFRPNFRTGSMQRWLVSGTTTVSLPEEVRSGYAIIAQLVNPSGHTVLFEDTAAVRVPDSIGSLSSGEPWLACVGREDGTVSVARLWGFE
jgi:hypothetical protein